MAHIAQFRHGDPLATSSPRVASLRDTASGRGEAAVQFVAPPLGRSASGTIVALPGQAAPPEEMAPYVNVPSHSRHHPSNNPAPSAIPPDNASLLTLASSTAAHSLGGAASSRGHGHQYTSSLGGARSIGGSLMGERRNSSDTYASVKALPPLSRRGSDSSSRTGRESVAASATGQNSAQAMLAGAGAGAGAGVAAVAAPGAPADRIR